MPIPHLRRARRGASSAASTRSASPPPTYTYGTCKRRRCLTHAREKRGCAAVGRSSGATACVSESLCKSGNGACRHAARRVSTSNERDAAPETFRGWCPESTRACTACMTHRARRHLPKSRGRRVRCMREVEGKHLANVVGKVPVLPHRVVELLLLRRLRVSGCGGGCGTLPRALLRRGGSRVKARSQRCRGICERSVDTSPERACRLAILTPTCR